MFSFMKMIVPYCYLVSGCPASQFKMFLTPLIFFLIKTFEKFDGDTRWFYLFLLMSIIQKFYAGIRTNYIAFINSSKKIFMIL